MKGPILAEEFSPTLGSGESARKESRPLSLWHSFFAARNGEKRRECEKAQADDMFPSHLGVDRD